MSTFIGVHGIRHHRPGNNPADVGRYWAEQWKNAIARGPLGQAADDIRLEFGYYAHRLRPVGTQGELRDLDLLEPVAQDMVRQWLAEHSHVTGLTQGGTTTPLRQAVAVLAHQLNYAPKAVESFAGWFFPEVSRYLYGDQNVRQQARTDIANAIAATAPPRIVIAHSLGSVVTYEALHHYSHLDVELMITIGSPLALGSVFDRLEPAPGTGRGVRPPSAARWINIADKGDLIAIPRHGIRNKFHGLSSDHEESIHWIDFHTAGSYLATASVAEALRPHLEAKQLRS